MPSRYNDKQVQFANCNGVRIEVRKYWAKNEPESDAYFVVYIQDMFDEYGEFDELDYETEAEAIAAFNGLVEEYRDKPNWNAQAAYDEAHGTINGEDPRVVEMRELWGE